MVLFLIRIVITTVVTLFIVHYIPGIVVKNGTDALIFGIIVGLVNALVRPILVLLTIPISVLSLGFFLLFINVFTFWLASEIAYGVHIITFWGAFWGGLIVWVTGVFTNRLVWKSRY